MDTQTAYKIVYEDMKNSGCELLFGKSECANSSFMHGIATVMEWIAEKVSEETYDEYENIFYKNRGLRG